MEKNFGISDLMGNVATWNADAFCVEDEEMANEILAEIENYGAVLVTDADELEDARAKLDMTEDDGREIYRAGGCLFTVDAPTMKASAKMRNTIARLEKKYGELNKEYFMEKNEDCRVGRGFWDGCRLTSTSPSVHINFIVAHDGSYWQ